MFIPTKFTVSEETTKEKPLNTFERGKLRFGKLKELANDGSLTLATNRAELAKLLGFTEKQVKQGQAGYAWVTRMVKNGYLKENVSYRDGKGHTYYGYQLTGKEPDYDLKHAREAAYKAKRDKKAKKNAPVTVQDTAPLFEYKTTEESAGIELSITKGDAVITLKGISNETILDIISSIWNN